MSNWGTLVATIRSRNNKSATEDDRIKTQLCDSIALHRRERLAWNQAAFSLTLTADQETYAKGALATTLPSDLIAIQGRELTLLYGGDVTDQQPVMHVSRETMREMRYGTSVSDAPCFWAFWDEKLELYPPSDLSTSVLKGSYIQDVGTPTYTATTANPPVFSFLKPDGTAMADSYTNPWFDQKQGFNIIRYHAEWSLWNGVWQATAGQGELAAQRYAEALDAAQQITDLQVSQPGQIEVWLP